MPHSTSTTTPHSTPATPHPTRSARFRRALAAVVAAVPVTVTVTITVAVVASLAGAGPLGVPAAAAHEGTAPAAQDGGAPLPPAAFYGNVTVDGEPAPVGTEIAAYVDGERRGRLVTDDPGTYGGSTVSEGKLVVNGTADDAGKTVTFRVDGEPANVTATWESGTVVNLDLSVDGGGSDGSGESGGRDDGSDGSDGSDGGDDGSDGRDDGSDGNDGSDEGDESNETDEGDGNDPEDGTDRTTDSGSDDGDGERATDGGTTTESSADTTEGDDTTVGSGKPDGMIDSVGETTDTADEATDTADETSNSGGLAGFGLVLTIGALLAGGGVVLRRS